MSSFATLVIAGLATGAIYALIAIGFALLWQASQTINFAQGEFVMLPAFFALVAMGLGLPYWAAALITFVLAAVLLGAMFKRLLVDPMLKHGVIPLAMATMALAIFLKESVKDLYSAEAYPFPSLVPPVNVNVLGTNVSLQHIAIIVVALVTLVALTWLLDHTTTGRQMQATAQNPTVARILGIPVERMIMLTFLINAVLVVIASLLVTPIYLAKFSSGETLGLAAFVAAIIGGFNQLRGAIVGGFLLGVIDNLAAAYVSTQYRAAVPLFILIAVILFRPEGLFGRKEERTV
ncbi:MAG: branched-chain amino acid ABC transporter permease [Hyphomicrobiaceae bacterium]